MIFYSFKYDIVITFNNACVVVYSYRVSIIVVQFKGQTNLS
jgi:hypothetical protein